MEPAGDTISYYVGRDPNKWAEGVKRYRKLVRHGVYPGIDVVYYGREHQLEYDFVLQSVDLIPSITGESPPRTLSLVIKDK